jgi:hypothetical protein
MRTFTSADVGPHLVDGRLIEASEAEKQTLAETWNAEQARRAAQPSYRELRKAAYIAELGKAEPASFVDTVGDVLDDLIREMRARGEPATAEAAALFAKIDQIKARFPKP